MIIPFFKKSFSGLSRNTLFITLASLFSDIATEMLYPILPIFLMQTLHASGSIIGIIEGVAQATQNIVQGFSGWLADKVKKRKTIALAGYLLGAFAKPLIGVSTVWQEVLGTRFLDRLGTGLRSAPRDALIASSVTPKHRGKAFGFEGVGDNLGAFLGPLITIYLLLVMVVDIRVIFYLAFIPAILACGMILFVKEKKIAAVPIKNKLAIPSEPFPKMYWRYLMVTAVFGLGNSSTSFLILQTQHIGASLITTIFIYAGFNLVAALISYPAGELSDKFGRKNILLIGFLIFFVSYTGLAFAHHIFLIGILFIFYGLFQGIFRAVGKSLAIDLVPPALHATGVGWYTATIGLLGLFASVIAGLLWDHLGPSAVFIYGAIFSLLGTLLLMGFDPSVEKK